jgi:amino acid adenylation domain-containing protein
MRVFLVDHVLRNSAQRAPDKVAVRAEGRSATYAEVDQGADRVAGALAAMGVARGDRVGLWLEKSVEAVIALYGIMRAGASYVPLDPSAPAGRGALIARDCEITALISDGKRVESLRAIDPGIAHRGIVNDDSAPIGFETWRSVQSGAQGSPDTPVVDTDLAYILYTSGSTGRPKGVMISHRNCLAFVDWARHEFAVQADDVLSNHAPLHFDLSTFDLFAAASAGSCVTLVPAGIGVFPIHLTRWIASQGVTVWYSVPSALTLLVRYGGLERHPIESLRLLLFAGEVFPNRYLRDLMRLLPRPRYFNLYGPTETNVCTYHEVSAPPAPEAPPIPIGKACANTRCWVQDQDGNEIVSEGVEGELVVEGSTVAQGYWGHPPNASGGFTAPHTFKTGDIVKWSRSGGDAVLRFVGRRDHMIKSRGYRIELGEIEAVLYAHRDVQEAAAVGVPDELLGNRLFAFCVSSDGDIEDELIQLCSKRLPPYMLPERIVPLASLPRTANGKVDRLQLAAKALDAAGQGSGVDV